MAFLEIVKNKSKKIVEKYNKKIKNINMGMAFKNWTNITDDIFVEEMNTEIAFDKDIKLIDVNDITQYDDTPNVLLYYIINELTKIINVESNKSIITHIVMFFIDMIDYIFDLFNVDKFMDIYDIKRFSYKLKAMQNYIYDMDVDNILSEEDKIGSDDLSAEKDREDEDNREMNSALDIDIGMDVDGDVEDMYESMGDIFHL